MIDNRFRVSANWAAGGSSVCSAMPSGVAAFICVGAWLLASLVAMASPPPPPAMTHSAIVKELVRCYHLSGQEQYDKALMACYGALTASRAIKDGPLELTAMQELASISAQIGNDFVSMKFNRDSLLHMLSAMKTLGIVGYYKQYMVVGIDFLNEDTSYFMRSLKKDSSFDEMVEMLEKFKSELEDIDPDDPEIPPDRRKLAASLRSEVLSVHEQFTRSLSGDNFDALKAAMLRMFRVLGKLSEMALKYAEDDQDREDARTIRGFTNGYSRLMEAYFAKDRKKLLNAVDVMFAPFDRLAKLDDGQSLDESVKSGSGESLAELERELESSSTDKFQEFAKLSRRQGVFRSVLLHFSKDDPELQAILRRHGYVTIADLRPYAERIQSAAESMRQQAAADSTQNEIPLPSVLPMAFDASANAVAVYSALTPEGQWLLSDKPESEALLVEGTEEIQELSSRTRTMERKLKVRSDFLSTPLLLRQAAIAFDRREYSSSVATLQRALDVVTARHDRDGVWQICWLLGLAQRAKGDSRAAISYVQRAIEENDGSRSQYRSETIRAVIPEDVLAASELLTGWLVESNDIPGAFGVVERTKARVLLDRFVNPGMANVPSLEKVRATLTSIAKLDLTLETDDSSSDEDRRARLNSEEDRYRLALEELRYTQPEFVSVLARTPTEAAGVQAAIDRDTVILEYYFVARHLLIFVISRESRLACIRVEVAEDDVAAQVAALRESIEREDEGYVQPAQKLYGLLIGPVESFLAGRRICIVPHGPLHFLPFPALLHAGKFLIEEHELSFAGSSATLASIARKPKGPATRVVIVSNPQGNLAAAEKESEDLAAIVKESLTLGAERATKSAVLSAIGEAKIIHFAAHAVLDKENPLSSHLVLANRDALGIVDLYAANLRADLVTLSACDTHLGKIDNGDEVIGLTRAFLFAGARSVLTTLWQVRSDDTTRSLMTTFYRSYEREGKPKSKALQDAQLAMIRSTSRSAAHPFNWAHFVLVGDAQ